MFFLYTVDRYSIMKSVCYQSFKSYNWKNGKTDESLRRKVIGPVKWQPVV